MASIYKLYPKRSALTVKASGPMREIISDIKIMLPSYIDPGNKHIDTRAIWDTGATGSVIDEKFADKIGLVPTGQARTIGVNGSKIVNTYTVDIQLPGGVNINSIPISSGSINVTNGIGFLIGMDVINIGDFAYSSHNNERVFTFRIPTIPVPIDFVQEITDFKKEESKHVANKKKVRKFNKRK